ncbi:MAG: hypothetical protein ACOC22_00065 [bacterium]
MTIVNFSVRNNLPTMVDVRISKELIPLYYTVNDSTRVDTIVPYFGEIKHPKNAFFLKSEIDSVAEKQIKSHIIFYEYDGLRVGWNTDDKKRVERIKPNRIYFDVCDENPRYEIRTLIYDASNTSWVTSVSLPEIDRIYVLYIPQHEYDVLKDEYKRKLPF